MLNCIALEGDKLQIWPNFDFFFVDPVPYRACHTYAMSMMSVCNVGGMWSHSATKMAIDTAGYVSVLATSTP